MEWLRDMRLKRAFVFITCFFLLISLVLVILVKVICETIQKRYSLGGVAIYMEDMTEQKGKEDLTDSEGVLYGTEIKMEFLEQPSAIQKRIVEILDGVWIVSCVLIPVFGMAASGAFFYCFKCKRPIDVLRDGVEKIQNHTLDFQIPVVSKDELGQLCWAFEIMRAKLLCSNRELWKQTEEQKRLNAAFSHDLRNPVTVLKGTIKMLREGIPDEQAIDRLERYILRMEQYIEAMSQIQRIDQMPVQVEEIDGAELEKELEETAFVLAFGVLTKVSVFFDKKVRIDHGIFLTVAENLIGNAGRYAQEQIEVFLEIQDGFLKLSVMDDGGGYPVKLIQDGPKPFGKIREDTEHFGMGLYSCQVLCIKHGGELRLKNTDRGAAAIAVFRC